MRITCLSNYESFMKNLSLLFILVFSACTTLNEEAMDVQLNGILDAYAAANYELNPLAATANGINDYNDRLAINISPEHIKKQLALNLRYLDTLSNLDVTNLTNADLLSVELLTYKLEMENRQLSNGYGINRPVDQFVFSFPQNFATLAAGASFVPFKTAEDYKNFIKRMAHFDQWVDQAIENMTEGLELKNTVPRASMVKLPSQLRPLYETPVEESIFYRPLQELPEEMDSMEAVDLKRAYVEAIETTLQPAYRKLNDYLVNQYIPRARTSTGLLDNSNGQEEYQFWLDYYTTLDMTPDEIYELGIREVTRIKEEMDSLRRSVGFEGDLLSFFEHVRTDAQFFPFHTEEEVLERYRSFESKMEPSLKKMFNLVPEAGFEVRATEKFREAGANAQYNPPSRDGKRPGIFYETVPNAKAYNYFEMETLFLHEAIPGHHYQVALQMEADLPEFRKSYWMSAYGEGWALYAETLGIELGMFKDPYQYLGRLSADMERAIRCVVDAGMHAKGWSREKAIQYILENQPVTEQVAIQRIERYMVTPGQAVSYKVGEQTLIRLREEARSTLGDQFDMKEFHDEVLKNGALPLKILEKQINRWMEGKLVG